MVNNKWLVGISVFSREFSDSSGYNGDCIVCMVICIYIPRLTMPILIQNTNYQANICQHYLCCICIHTYYCSDYISKAIICALDTTHPQTFQLNNELLFIIYNICKYLLFTSVASRVSQKENFRARKRDPGFTHNL